MINELDIVALTHDIAKNNLKQGDIGAVVHCYKDDASFEVEFVSVEGKTIALLALNREDIRPLGGIETQEVLHVRELLPIAV